MTKHKTSRFAQMFVQRAKRPCTVTDPPNYFIWLLSAAKAGDLVLWCKLHTQENKGTQLCQHQEKKSIKFVQDA